MKITYDMMVEALNELTTAAPNDDEIDPEGIAGALGFVPDDLLKLAGVLAYNAGPDTGPGMVVAILLGFVLGEDKPDLSKLEDEVRQWRLSHPDDSSAVVSI